MANQTDHFKRLDTASRLALCVQQIKRDMESLRTIPPAELTPWWRVFYENRIAIYQAWAKELQNEVQGNESGAVERGAETPPAHVLD